MVLRDTATEVGLFENIYERNAWLAQAKTEVKEGSPFKVLYGGFASWIALLHESFPSELWPDGEHGTPIEEALFRRFAEIVLSKPSFSFLTEEERVHCIQEGWEDWAAN